MLASGCGGDRTTTTASPVALTKPRAVAQAWVTAIDTRNFERACALSDRPTAVCPQLLAQGVGARRPTLRIAGYFFYGPTAEFFLSGEPSWRHVQLIERAGRYYVHFEVTVIH